MAVNCTDYDFSIIEPYWQKKWLESKTFQTLHDTSIPKYYILDMFPYPSGAGLHIGHPEGYTATDILARFKKANGFNVLHPMGWDAFGLPAEQYAIKTGTHPAETTSKNVENFRRQIQRIGFAIDWDREINTTDPNYFKWTQFIFLELFKKGLAYVDEKPVWWCQNLKAVLANEEIVNGLSEVGKHPVERKNLRQVVLKITKYADRLLDGLKDVDWPDSTKRMQKAWIGKSTGAEVCFQLDGFNDNLTVFTTRPDTLYGATYMVVAPEHPILDKIVTSENKETVAAYQELSKTKSDLDRTELAKEKTGVFSGSFCINPINGAKIPVWIADYVLVTYGTGAIMSVPAHDERDFEFAKEFNLPIIQVIEKNNASHNGDGKTKLPFCSEGRMIHSGDYTGLSTKDCKSKIIAHLERKKIGKATVNFKLRDWIFSRQRYWGEPIPLVWVSKEDYHETAASNSDVAKALPSEPIKSKDGSETLYALPILPKFLPLKLPVTDSYQPSGTGESPLVNQSDWLNIWFHKITGETLPRSIEKPNSEWIEGVRESNTMPQWAGSCWYYLRYMDPHNDQEIVSKEAEKYWQNPDLYIGGAEHAVLHLLYARFWHQVLFDCGLVSTKEPFTKLFHQGIILGEDGSKMSKSVGNVVSPDDIIDESGADALRLYEMFLGPLEAMKPWNTSGIEGISRFLKRIWREFIGEDGKINSKIVPERELEENIKILHTTIQKVTEDIEGIRLNTAISQMMIFMNHIQKSRSISTETAKVFLQLLAPFAPHIAEEIWSRFGEKQSITLKAWPKFDPKILLSKEMKIMFQVNGKLRGEANVSIHISEEEVIELAKSNIGVLKFIEDKRIVKEIYVPGKIVNIVAK